MALSKLQKRQSPNDLLKFHNSSLSKLLASAHLKIDGLEARVFRDESKLKELEMRLAEAQKEISDQEKDRMFLLDEINILNKKLEQSSFEKSTLEAENKKAMKRNFEIIGELAAAWAENDSSAQESELLPQLSSGFEESVGDLMKMLKQLASEKPRIIIETIGSPAQQESQENLKRIYGLEDELRETKVKLGETSRALKKAEESLRNSLSAQESLRRDLDVALRGQNEANSAMEALKREFDDKMAEMEFEKQEAVELIEKQLGQTLKTTKEADERIKEIREMDEEQLRSVDTKGIQLLLEMYTRYKEGFEQSEERMARLNEELNQKLASAICAVEENFNMKKGIKELQEALSSCSKELVELQQSKKLFDKVSPKISSIKCRMLELVEQNKVYLFENALLRKKHNDHEVFPMVPSSLESFSGSMNPVELSIYRKIEDLTEHNERLKNYVRKQNALEIAKRDKEIENLQKELKRTEEESAKGKEELEKTKEEMGRMVKVVKYQEYLMEMRAIEYKGLVEQINLMRNE